MTERELANRVVDLVDETAYQQHAARVTAIRLGIGSRRKFDLPTLTEEFQRVARGTVAEGARLEVHVLIQHRRCRACGFEFDTLVGEECPECGAPRTRPIGGEELRIEQIEWLQS
jgi:hydrogenase nickel incorporation protein HypA/HybF